MSHDSDQEQRIFNDALEITDPEERATFLRSACGDDDSLRERIEALLKAAGQQDVLFAPDSPEDQDDRLGDDEGKVIGPYKLLERIGEGAFGVVYMAEQEEPVRRRVALKIIKPGMDTRQVIARFEAERQALAMMDHPNIAQVFDAGATDSGRPYFVMELVRGVPITKFCDAQQLGIEERLRLFRDVCRAVQHAHQKGIIHRDLKPSNILVTLHGRQAVPKVIDFGIVKATQQRLTEKTLFTRFHLFIGTPEYMSPEQAEMSGLDVDTRSDIYSLGVLLYELLTGSTPLPRKDLLREGYDGMRRMIREREPERPSTRLTKTAARDRHPDLEQSWLRGDLDRIVMKAIDKDRDRRYESADALDQDIQRFLNQEPVQATATTTLYRFRKFARRNRTSVTAGALVALALIVGLAVAMMGLVRARTEAIRATEQAATAEAVVKFLNDGLLAQADPFFAGPQGAGPRNLKLLSAIQSAAQGIEDRFRDQPLVEAAIRLTLGRAFMRLAEHEAAETHLQRAALIYGQELGPEAPRTLEARQEIAWLRTWQMRLPEAEELSRQLLDTQSRLHGPNHETTLEAMTCLGHACVRGSKDDEAVELFQEVLRLAPDVPELDPRTVLYAMTGLSWAYYQLGQIEEKVSVARATYEKARTTLGPDHPITLDAMQIVGNDLRLRRQAYHESWALTEECRERCLRVLGEAHPITIATLSEITGLEAVRGLNYIPLQKDLVALSERALGPDDTRTIFERMRLGLGLLEQGYPEEGARLLEQDMETVHRTEGPDTLSGRRVMRWLARSYISQGRFAEAEQLRTLTAHACQRLYGMANAWTHNQFYALGNLYARQGKWSPAAEAFRSFLSYPPSNPSLRPSPLARITTEAHVAALLAQAMARDPTGTAETAALMLSRFADTNDPELTADMSLALLLVPEATSDASAALQLAAGAINDLSDPLKRGVLSGISAYHRDLWTQATDELTPLAANRDGKVAAVAGLFLAMSLYQNGLRSSAVEALAEATRRLEGMLRCGDLGNTVEPGREWTPLAAAIIARARAEELIHGRQVSPRIEQDYLSRNRAAWQPVRELIEQAGWAARRQDWAEARNLFIQATQHDCFDWTAAAHCRPGLEEEIACVLVLDGQLDRHGEFCRENLRNLSIGLPENLRAVLLSSDSGLRELQHKALELARRQRDEGVRREAPQSARVWDELTLGMAECRTGDLDRALAALAIAQTAYNLNCSGTARAFAAMAEAQSGHAETARHHLQLAQAAFQELLDGRRGDLGDDWKITAVSEVALNEARCVVHDAKFSDRPHQEAVMKFLTGAVPTQR